MFDGRRRWAVSWEAMWKSPSKRSARALAPGIAALVLLPVGMIPASEPAAPPAQPAPAAEAPSNATAGTDTPAPGGWFGTDRPLVVPPFVDEFPGVDIKNLTPPERERFLHRANTEPCPCGQGGCPHHTLGFCLKVDPGCPTARGALRKIATGIVAARPKTAPARPAGTPPPR